MTTRTELLEALRRSYGDVGRVGKTRILDEFVSVTGYHRKHAVRLLCLGASSGLTGMKPRRGVYSDAVREALVVLWEASDGICGKRLHALLPSLVGSMERHGHLELCEDVRVGLLGMSAATIDRQLRGVREAAGGRRRRRTLSPSSVRRRIPVRTGTDWQDAAPGFMEGDLVAHSGPVARGSVSDGPEARVFDEVLRLIVVGRGAVVCPAVTKAVKDRIVVDGARNGVVQGGLDTGIRFRGSGAVQFRRRSGGLQRFAFAAAHEHVVPVFMDHRFDDSSAPLPAQMVVEHEAVDADDRTGTPPACAVSPQAGEQ